MPYPAEENRPVFEGEGDIYRQVIENAGGVPFHLLFGERVGEGCYLHVGRGIEALVGLRPEEFTEARWQRMILRVVPRNPGISPDPALIADGGAALGELVRERA